MEHPYPPQGPAQIQDESPAMAVIGFVLSLVSLVPFIGFFLAVPGLILGIVSVSKRKAGRGLAIAAIVLSSLGMMVSCSCTASTILLPALSKARETARQMKSGSQMRGIGQGITLMHANGRAVIGQGWDQTLVYHMAIGEEMLISPWADAGDVSYFLVPTADLDNITQNDILLFENPAFYPADVGGTNVLYTDGRVEFVTGPMFQKVLSLQPTAIPGPAKQ